MLILTNGTGDRSDTYLDQQMSVATIYRDEMELCLFVPNANPLHYYALQVPRKADKWH